MDIVKLLIIFSFSLNLLYAGNKCGSSNSKAMQKIEYKKAIQTYVNGISYNLAEQLSETVATYKRATLLIKMKKIVNLYEKKQTSIATQKIEENLIHEMFLKNFNIISQESSANSYMQGTYTNYKNGMLINARIVDKKSGLVYASAQVFLDKKELKSINKIYKKYTWFSE